MIPKEHYGALELNQIFMTSVIFKHINDFCIKWAGDPAWSTSLHRETDFTSEEERTMGSPRTNLFEG